MDSAGNAYVTGDTSSTNFPTKNPLQPANGSYDNAFISKLDPTGSALVYSTYFGGSDEADGFAIGVDAVGNASIAGYTLSPTDFPTKNPIQSAYGGGPYDGYVARLNAAGTSLDFSSFIGGSNGEIVGALAVDPAGNLFLAGYTNSTDFPTTPGAFQPAAGGVSDVFVMKIATTTSPLSLVVNTTDDEINPGNGTTSLREAITAANAAPGSSISFDPAVFPARWQRHDSAHRRRPAPNAGVEVERDHRWARRKALAITGGGAGSNFSVFTVDAGVTATLSGLTVTGGHSLGVAGGIFNQGTLTLNDSAITSNSSASGGGLFSSGTIALNNCTVAANTGDQVGGIFDFSAKGATLINCTIANNTGDVVGGIVHNSSAVMLLIGCTVAGNRAVNGPGGGIEFDTSTLTLRNSIVAGNFFGAAPTTVPGDIVKTAGAGMPDLISMYNLIGAGGSGGVVASLHNLVGVDPRLGPLQDNGGPTQTMALLDGSPAFNAGSRRCAWRRDHRPAWAAARVERHGRHRGLRIPDRPCGTKPRGQHNSRQCHRRQR